MSCPSLMDAHGRESDAAECDVHIVADQVEVGERLLVQRLGVREPPLLQRHVGEMGERNADAHTELASLGQYLLVDGIRSVEVASKLGDEADAWTRTPRVGRRERRRSIRGVTHHAPGIR
jgi:hypothetical protein